MTTGKPAYSVLAGLPWLYATAALRLMVPLLLLPVMARRLGVESFGQLSFFLLWGGVLSLLIEGGFLAAATRVAVTASGEQLRSLARQIFSARCVLSLLALPLAVAVSIWMHGGWSVSALKDASWMALLACVMGWPATWYLQATQQLSRWARVEWFWQLGFLSLALAFAHSVEGYLLCHAALALALAVHGWTWLRKDLALDGTELGGFLSLRAAILGLRLGVPMLSISIAGATYSVGLPAMAASLLSRADLGGYFMADRLVRALLAAADPVVALVYPRMVLRFKRSAKSALRFACLWALAGLVCGLLMMGLGALYAGDLEQLLQGRTPSAGWRPSFVVLSALLPLLLAWRFIGYWMLGSGRFDSAYRRSIWIGAVVGLMGAWLFTPMYGVQGLASVAVAAELAVMASAVLGAYLTLQMRRA